MAKKRETTIQGVGFTAPVTANQRKPTMDNEMETRSII